MRLAAALCILLAPSLLSAQVRAGEDLPVEVDVALPLVEPWLAIHPTDPGILAAAALAGNPDGTWSALVFSSQDGGRTWRTHDPGVRAPSGVRVEFLSDGTAVFAAGARLFRSKDGVWSAAATLEGDHPRLAVNGSGLYLISSGRGKGPSGRPRDAILAARSTDGGTTFSEPGRAVVSNLQYEAHDAAVSSEGALLVAFADYARPGERRRLERQRDWLLVREGSSFSEPLLISETCDSRGGWSSLALNLSDRLAPPDRLFHVCAAARLGGIQLRYTDTFGEIWSAPVRVDRPGSVAPSARTPAVAVNRDGVVGVAWHDGRGSTRCTEVFFAASLDGGATFLPEVKVSSGRSCSASPGVGQMGLAAAADGTFRLLWADSRSGTYRLRTATVSVEVPSGGASPRSPASP